MHHVKEKFPELPFPLVDMSYSIQSQNFGNFRLLSQFIAFLNCSVKKKNHTPGNILVNDGQYT